MMFRLSLLVGALSAIASTTGAFSPSLGESALPKSLSIALFEDLSF